MSAVDIIVPSNLGNEFNFQLPSSLPSCKTFEIRVQPVNSQSFTAGNVIQFDLPCNKRGQYLDPTTTYIRFKSTYTHAGTLGTDKSVLLGTGYSYFNKQEVYGNNSITLESINEIGVLANFLINTQLNASDKVGMAPAFGVSDTHLTAISNIGHSINDSALNGVTFEYALPLIGILGSGTDKLLPVGSFYSLRLELTMDNFANFTLAATTANAVTACVISDVEFVGQIIELDNDSQSLIEAQNPNKIHIRTQSYRTATNSLPGGSVGLIDLLIGTRVSSLKSLYITCVPSNSVEGKFCSVCPNLGQGTCLVLSGQNLPQRTINMVNRPSDAFMELQKSLGALSSTVYNGCVNKTSYYTSSTTTGLCIAYNTNKANIYTAPNSFFMGFNTEIISHRGGLLSGININSSPSFFRAQIVSALSAYTHTLYFFAFHDVILEIDVQAKTIVAKF